MTKYHVKPDGTYGICKATHGACPYTKEGAVHFDNEQEAMAYAESIHKRIKSHPSPVLKHALVDDVRLEASDVSGSRISDLTVRGVMVDDDYVLSTTEKPTTLSGVRAEASDADDLKANNLIFTDGILNQVTLNGASLRSLKLTECMTNDTSVFGADMTRAQINGNDLINTMFDGSNFSGATVNDNSFQNVSFNACDLKDAEIRRNRFSGCVFNDAKNMTTASIHGNGFYKCDFTYTGLTPGDIPPDNDLEESYFREGNVESVYLRDGTGRRADLSLSGNEDAPMFSVRMTDDMQDEDLVGWASRDDMDRATDGMVDLSRFVDFESGRWMGTDIPANEHTLMFETIE